MGRAPALAVEDMRRLDTERCEDIYRGLAPGIMRGHPASGSVAIRALEHKAKISGYSVVQEVGKSSSALSIHIHLDDEADAPKPVNDLRRRMHGGQTQ